MLILLKVVSIACCVFLSHCRETVPLEPRNLKDKVCSSWLGPVESASYYYPLIYMWDNYGRAFVIYGKVRTAIITNMKF